MTTQQNVFEKCGCEEDTEFEGLYTHPKLPFEMYEDNGTLALGINLEYRVDKGNIPLTEKNLNALIEAFNPK